MSNHDDVASRWASRIINPGRGPLKGRNLHDHGDRIFSYGSHFEVARIIRDRKGQPETWLLNGDRFSVTTSKHQAAVRQAVFGTGIPSVTIPYSALSSAGVDLSTIKIVDVQRDWWTNTTVTREDAPGRWSYDTPACDDDGGWQNSKTGEIVMRKDYQCRTPQIECDHEITLPGPWNVGYAFAPWNWEHEYRLRQAREAHVRAQHGVWEAISPSRRQTGRKRMISNSYIEWDLVDAPDSPLGYVFQRQVQRHWLGGSLITGQVSYQVQVKHAGCGGTGVADEKWYTRGHSNGIGPLTEEQMTSVEESVRYRTEVRGQTDVLLGWPWEIDTYNEHTECRGCSGRGRVSATRRRRAYFLSGFDENETRPSYFFCELPPKVRPTTVEEALETLKPTAVKLAEQAGRDVKRQGDVYAVDMGRITLKELKARGGVHERNAYVLGTNHQATEVVTVGGLTYARGTLRHAPEFRRPDHKRLTLGNRKNFFLLMKNTVPVAV